MIRAHPRAPAWYSRISHPTVYCISLSPPSAPAPRGAGGIQLHIHHSRARLTQMCGGAWSMEDGWTHSRRRARCPCHVYTKK